MDPTITLVRGADGALTVSGARECQLGQRIPLADGERDGIYAGWRWDGRALTIEQDRYGFYPLFAWTTSRTCTISPSLQALLDAGAPADFDYEALSVFLRVGFFVGHDTPFRAIRALPPQAALHWDGDEPRVLGRAPQMPTASAISRDDAIDALIDRVRTAVRRRLPDGPFHMPLSGGRDSRHILFELVAAGAPPSGCVTVEHYPPRGNDDATIAAALCARLGVRHVLVPQPIDRARAERHKNIRTHFCSDEHSQFVVLADYLQNATRVTYDGIAGDVLSQSSYLNPDVHALAERRDAGAIARYVLDGYGSMVSEAALARLLSRHFLREVPRDRAESRLARQIGRHLDAPNPIASFFFWNRARREIALAPYGLMRGLVVHAPFLDRDVFDLLASLPASLEMDRRLHTDAIARAFPQHVDVPYEVKSARTRNPALQRRLAFATGRAVMSTPAVFCRDALAPGIAATLADGSSERLWHAPLTLYLAQLAALAARAR